MSTPANQVQIKFTDKEGNVETLWAFPLGENRYKLDNTPWLAYGVSWQDIVEARWTEAEDFPEFVRVLEKSGFRTIRIILTSSISESSSSKAILNKLQEMGCKYEGANPKFISVDIPPKIDLTTVRDYLISTGQQWEYADPCYDDLFPDQGRT